MAPMEEILFRTEYSFGWFAPIDFLRVRNFYSPSDRVRGEVIKKKRRRKEKINETKEEKLIKTFW